MDPINNLPAGTVFNPAKHYRDDHHDGHHTHPLIDEHDARLLDLCPLCQKVDLSDAPGTALEDAVLSTVEELEHPTRTQLRREVWNRYGIGPDLARECCANLARDQFIQKVPTGWVPVDGGA